jgi:hypothetical protein
MALALSSDGGGSLVRGIALSKTGFIVGVLLLAALLPQLPPVFGRSEFHINIFFLIVAITIICLWRAHIPVRYVAVSGAYFFVLQLLLLLSYVAGVEGMESLAEIPSLLRPSMLFIVTLSFSILMMHDNAFEACIKASVVLTVLSFFYAILEVFAFDAMSPLFHLLYRLPDKKNIDGVSVSFFTLPYYAAYVHSILMLFVLAGLSLRPGFFLAVVLIMSVLNVVLTQSKMGIFVVFLSLFLYWFLSVRAGWRAIVACIGIVFFSASVYFLYDLIKYLNEAIGGNFAYTTLMILERPDEAGNLAERNRQVVHTFHLLESGGWLIGVGLGKGVLIESWIAYVPYRYGMLGFGFFVLFYLVISFIAFGKSCNLRSQSDRIMARVIAVWAFAIFFTQLSSLSMEMSKSAVYTALMLGMTSVLFLKKISGEK